MLRLIRAGLVAAGLQLGAVVVVTLLVMLPALDSTTFQSTPSIPRTPEIIWSYASPFLIWSYLIVAVGIALSNSKFTFYTAEHIRAAAQHAHIDREQTLMSLLVCLAIPALLVASFALEPPPVLLVEAVRYFDYNGAAGPVWGAAMSIAVAGLGSMAHAVKRALYR